MLSKAVISYDFAISPRKKQDFFIDFLQKICQNLTNLKEFLDSGIASFLDFFDVILAITFNVILAITFV